MPDAVVTPESSDAAQPAGELDLRREGGMRGTFREITEDALRRLEVPRRAYRIALAACAGLALLGAVAWGFQIWFGMSLSGLNHPIMWAVYITNFTWWIGIAHAGSLFSALLFLFRAPFRPAFARMAEAMTLIAAVTAAIFPVIHLGRPWRAYWLFPYPNQRDLWVTFRSPLILDVSAVVSYLGLSVLFFWIGLLPDLAVLRDRSKGWPRTLYGLLSLGWEGRGREWKHHQAAYSLLAVLLTVLVFFHAGGAWNLSLSINPGWHSTLFPPYFIAASVFSGLGMLLLLAIPLRTLLSLEDHLTRERLDRVARLLLALSLFLSLSYAMEYYTAWHSPNPVERANLMNKMFGTFAPYFWIMTVLNSLVPLVFFWRTARRSLPVLLAVSIAAVVGVWLDRFVVIAGSQAVTYLPYTWADAPYRMTLVEWGILLGSLGWFLLAYLLFVRLLPVLPIAELKRDHLREHRERRAVREAEGPA